MRFQHWLYKLPLRLRSLFRRRNVEQELEAELQFHLDRQIDRYIENGMDPREARYAALRQMGGLEQHKEAVRDARGMNLVDNFLQDLRYAFRTLRRSRGFTTVAVTTLAIGIGGITTIFSVVNGVLLRALPYEDADRLISIAETITPFASARPYVPPPKGADWMDRPEISAVLDGLTWLEAWRFEAPERTESPIVMGARVPPNYFSTIRSTPQLGRNFTPVDATGSQPTVAIVSYPFWQRWLGGDPNVIGKSITFAGGPLTVVGVMPRAFRSPFFGEAQLWAVMPQDFGRGSIMVGRMKPGITAQAAQAGIDGIIKRVEREYPANAARRETTVEGLVRAEAFYRNLLLLLFGSVALILLMSVINVGNLMLSRSLTRNREVAIRSALGAGKRRLVRQLLTESLLVAVPGGVLGIAVATAGVNLIVMGLPSSFPRLHEVYLDATVMVFALVTTVIASIAFGVFPAFAFARTDLQQSLKNGAPTASQSRRSLHLRQALVAAEIGLAAILLIGAALMGKSFWNLLDEPLGMETDNVSVARLLMRPRPEAVRTAFYDELIQRISQYPGVDSAGLSSHTPLTDSFFRPPFTIEGRTGLDNASAVVIGVTSDYFRTLRIEFLDGRSVSPNEQSAVINERLARDFWPNANPIGSRIKPAPQNSPWLTIVGVVRDEKLAPGSEDFPVIYRACGLCGALIIKARDASTDVGALIRREVAALDNTTLITGIQTVDEIAAQAETVIGSRFQMALFFAFAGAGLLLALAGVYGVTSYASAQRTQEVGIRLALGATRFTVLSMMMRQSMRPILLGITAGVAVASALTGFLQSYLFQVTPLDASVFAAVPVFLVLVAIIANFIPVRRGTRIDPMIALRHE